MKRILTLMLTIGLIFGLVACGGNDEEDTVDPNETEENQKTEEVEKEEAPEETETEEPASESKTEGNSELADYEEALVIEDEIDVSDLDIEVEADNENKRVILFKDGNRATYKTIYIKGEQRLKVIDIIDNEGEIYNEIMK